MSIPDYQSLMLPLLKLASDGQEHSLAVSTVASYEIKKIDADYFAED
jgi:restriction endonuclease Mrr